MVQVLDVTKKYGESTVVDSVTVTIPKKQITSFIGPNGAGKSTLLSIISRLIEADSGDVLVENKRVHDTNQTELAKKVSILKQANSISIRLTIKELVSFGRFPYSKGRLTKEDWRHVDEAIEYMGLKEMENKHLDELSGGQKQRAFIAMVIAQDTEYILLDEPLNNLDMKHSVQIMKVLRKMVKDLGKTIVIVLHDINFASFYSDYIVALKEGRVVHEGATRDMITNGVLKDVYDMDIEINEVNNQRVCVYFV
ncbi:ABC transporter ATP-binding protein [Alteribacter aurantiacus]|uniref:iron ABC transporter ATP-binding protein n=1 Tax=Alteribacter aurantiacus TaxID=254410 RepID=UPI000401BD8C|nr:ATP-binding cassette domain-containing protein [Alteribacter aurantiacus]